MPSPPCLFSSVLSFADNPPLLGGTGAPSPQRRTFAFLIFAMENPEGTVKITHVFESRHSFSVGAVAVCITLCPGIAIPCHTLPHLAFLSPFLPFFSFLKSGLASRKTKARLSNRPSLLSYFAPTLSFLFLYLFTPPVQVSSTQFSTFIFLLNEEEKKRVRKAVGLWRGLARYYIYFEEYLCCSVRGWRRLCRRPWYGW